ncbi:MAG: hypothetical protein ACLFNT_00490 [Spirochaetales bacterium]
MIDQRKVVIGLLAAVAVLVSGCSPDIVIVSDPLLEAIIPSRQEWEREISVVARQNRVRVGFEWPSAELLDQLDFDEIVSRTDAPKYLLSPYASLFANELATRHPERGFIVTQGGPHDAANITTVSYAWNEGWQAAGNWVANWLAEDAQRRAVVFASEEDQTQRERVAALREAVERAGEQIEIRLLAESIRGDATVSSLADSDFSGTTLVIFMAHGSDQSTFTSLYDSATFLALPGVYIRDGSEQVLLAVRADLSEALAAHLSMPSARVVTAPVTVEARESSRDNGNDANEVE